MAEYVTGEQHKDMVSTARPRHSSGGPLVMVVAALILLGIGFAAGIGYQKGHQSSSATSQTAAAAGGSQFGRFSGRRGTLGSVTAVSSTSITVQDVRTSTSTTFNITSTTQISNAGSSVAVSNIQVGDTVLVRADQSNSKQAARILVSPAMGGPGTSSTGGTAPTTNSQSITN